MQVRSLRELGIGDSLPKKLRRLAGRGLSSEEGMSGSGSEAEGDTVMDSHPQPSSEQSGEQNC